MTILHQVCGIMVCDIIYIIPVSLAVAVMFITVDDSLRSKSTIE